MPLGIAGERNLAQAVALDQSGGQEIVGVGERTHRMVWIAADDQSSRYRRFGLRALQEVVRLRETREPTHRDMGHRVETGMPQSRTGSDDVVMRDTSRVVDEYGRAGIQQLAQLLSSKVVARRDLDRACGNQFSRSVPREIGCRTRFFNRGAHQPKPRLREMT